MSLKIWATVFTWINIFLIIFLGIFIAKLMSALNKYLKSSNGKPENRTPKTIGDVLKEYRIKNNMTQEFVAQALNVSRQAVSKWENNISEPSTSNLLAIAKLYNIPSEELISQINTK